MPDKKKKGCEKQMPDFTGFSCWLQKEGKTQKTIKQYLYNMQKFFKEYLELTQENGRSWVQSMEKEHIHPKTILLRITAFNAYCKWYGKEGYRLKPASVLQNGKEERFWETRHLSTHLTPCRGCVYRRPFVVSDPSTSACHYCIDTGKLRGMSPEQCYLHPGTPYTPGTYVGSLAAEWYIGKTMDVG